LQRKDTNIGILAHDLRNPLTAIATGAALLARLPETTQRAERIVERINKSARRMTVLIHDILDYTRGRLGGGIQLKRQPTDLGALSRSVVDEIRAGHPAAEIQLETAGKLTGDWDPARIEQALSNLVANAVQHGGRNIRLTASGEERDQVVLTVWNDGDAIPQEHLAGVFDAFNKGDQSPSGLGLGLFIVREIAQAHMGNVGVTSGADGTAFTVRLPRSNAADGTTRQYLQQPDLQQPGLAAGGGLLPDISLVP